MRDEVQESWPLVVPLQKIHLRKLHTCPYTAESEAAVYSSVWCVAVIMILSVSSAAGCGSCFFGTKVERWVLVVLWSLPFVCTRQDPLVPYHTLMALSCFSEVCWLMWHDCNTWYLWWQDFPPSTLTCVQALGAHLSVDSCHGSGHKEGSPPHPHTHTHYLHVWCAFIRIGCMPRKLPTTVEVAMTTSGPDTSAATGLYNYLVTRYHVLFPASLSYPREWRIFEVPSIH